jgi:chromosome segregation ATPase
MVGGSVSAEHSNGLHSRALSAISVEADSLRDKLHRASEALASADEQLHAARRDAYFLRMRTGVLQAFIDDLQLELSQRSSDTVMVAARFDDALRDRERVMRELATTFQHRISELEWYVATLTASGIAQQHSLAERRDQLGSIVTSKSWQITKPIRWLADLFRGTATKQP